MMMMTTGTMKLPFLHLQDHVHIAGACRPFEIYKQPRLAALVTHVNAHDCTTRDNSCRLYRSPVSVLSSSSSSSAWSSFGSSPIPPKNTHVTNTSTTAMAASFSIPAPTAPLPGTPSPSPSPTVQRIEEMIEMIIFNCRFLTLMGVAGSLAGSVICFLKGCFYVVESFREYFLRCWNTPGTGKVILLLVEAVDVYLMGTVMLIFGMGLYELFVSSLDVPSGDCLSGDRRTTVCGSNLFGLFSLKARPKWLEIRSLDQLKTKLGHVIVMILLVGMFDKSKKVPVNTGVDLLCFSASILLSSGCLFLLSKLHSSKDE